MVIGDTSRDLQLGNGKGIISRENEYTYLRVRITKDGNHEPEINDRINRVRAAITKLNSILWDRDVFPKTKTHIYHVIVKSTITYAAGTWCLKAKTVAKLNSTEMEFWRRSARISRKDKIRNTIIKQKNECRKISFRQILKPNNFNGTDTSNEWKRGEAFKGKKKTR
jgi:chaperonin GroEL (HSP60 family)